MADTSWLDEAPDASWLDDAPDAPSATKSTGMGDVQAAPSARIAPEGNTNVPAGLLTGDPSTDARIGQNFATAGNTQPISGRDVAQAAAIGLGGAAGLATGAPVLGGAISSGLISAGLSKARDAAGVAQDAGLGAVLGGTIGAGAKVIGEGLSRLGGWAGQKAGEAIGKAATRAKGEAEAALRSEVGTLGAKAQHTNRQIEWVIRLLDEESSGTITPQNRALLESFRGSPEYAELTNKAAERVLQQAPEAVGELSAQEAKVAQMKAGMPQAVADATEAATAPAEAKHQVWERVKRYGPVAVGTAVGAHVGGPLGVAIGSLAGAGTRPMVRALGRMATNPAVQRQFYEWLESAAVPVVRGSTAATNEVAGPAASMAERATNTQGQTFLDWLRSQVPDARLSLAGAGDREGRE